MVDGNIHLIEFQYDHYNAGMKKVSSGLSPVIAVDRKEAKPLHKQIYDAFRAMIVSGRISRSSTTWSPCWVSTSVKRAMPG